MRHLQKPVRLGRVVIALALVGAGVMAAHAAAPEPNPDALWQIVSGCIAVQPGSYCTCPIFARSCCGDVHTPDASVVLATTDDFVAIRDMKSCGCGADFVADLAIPRERVTGLEDPHRPEGIWAFAWDVGRSQIGAEDAIALVINPRSMRTQDQLHVHILRIRPDERGRLDALDGAPSQGGMVGVSLPDLRHVFGSVVAALGTDQIGDRGLLVMRARDGAGFRAVVTEGTSPERFTVARCDGHAGAGR